MSKGNGWGGKREGAGRRGSKNLLNGKFFDRLVEEDKNPHDVVLDFIFGEEGTAKERADMALKVMNKYSPDDKLMEEIEEVVKQSVEDRLKAAGIKPKEEGVNNAERLPSELELQMELEGKLPERTRVNL